MQQNFTRNSISHYDIKKTMIRSMCNPLFSEMWIAYFTDQFKYHKDLILHQFSWDDSTKSIICDLVPKKGTNINAVEAKQEIEKIEQGFLEFCAQDQQMISIIEQNTVPLFKQGIMDFFRFNLGGLTFFIFSNMMMSSVYNKENFVFRIEIVD